MDDSVPAMVWAARPDLSCEFLSRAWREFTGCAADQPLDEAWCRGVHPEDLPRWLDVCVRAFDAREPFEIEYRLRRRDADYRWVSDRGRPRFAGPDGAFLGFAGHCVDIHEKRQGEAELARALERERKLRLASDDLLHLSLLAGVRVMVVDDDPRVRETIARVLGLAGAESIAACSSAEALSALNAFRPDVLLSEVGTQGGPGAQLLRALRSWPAGRRGCPRAAALTRPGRLGDSAVPPGYDAQLAKPVEPVALVATVARLAVPTA